MHDPPAAIASAEYLCFADSLPQRWRPWKTPLVPVIAFDTRFEADAIFVDLRVRVPLAPVPEVGDGGRQ